MAIGQIHAPDVWRAGEEAPVSNTYEAGGQLGYFEQQEELQTVSDIVRAWSYDKSSRLLEFSWNVMAQDDAREGKWRGTGEWSG